MYGRQDAYLGCYYVSVVLCPSGTVFDLHERSGRPSFTGSELHGEAYLRCHDVSSIDASLRHLVRCTRADWPTLFRRVPVAGADVPQHTSPHCRFAYVGALLNLVLSVSWTFIILFPKLLFPSLPIPEISTQVRGIPSFSIILPDILPKTKQNS